MKRKLVAAVVGAPLVAVALLGLHRLAFPWDQVHWVNYMMIREGMSKDTVQWLMGHHGWTLANPPNVGDGNSPNACRPLVNGEKICIFHNRPPPNTREAVYVGFANDLVVDKYFGATTKD